MTVDAGSAPARLVGAAGAALVVYVACFPHRLEYPAHVLAGMGLAGLALVAMDRTSWSAEARAALTLVAVAVAAVVSEKTVTGPSVDVLDVGNTLVGAVIGIAAVLAAARVGRRPVVAGVAAGLVFLGLVVRYVVQTALADWWWFGA